MKIIQEQITRISGFMGLNDEKALTRVLKFRSLKLGLDVQGIGTQQVEVLARAQGKKYVPFLTGALNQAIGNLNAIYKTQLEAIRAMEEKAQMAPGINVDKEFGNTGKAYLTTDIALKMIENQPTLLDDIGYLNAKELEIGALPDVVARNQDLSTIGIKLKKTILIPQGQPNSPIPSTTTNPHRPTHTERREADGDII